MQLPENTARMVTAKRITFWNFTFMSVFLNEALRLAALGYPVFPCFPKTKKPANEDGVSGASCDPALVTAWWRRNPRANIGLACHHCLIIDVDVKPEEGKRGDLDMPILVEALGTLPRSPMAKSGGGGWHLFFQKPQEEVSGQPGVPWQGKATAIDIRVGNQYVVAPPSVHESENLYEWVRPPVAVAELPCLPQRWIDDFLPKRREGGGNCLEVPAIRSGLPPPDSGLSIIERCRKYVATIPPAIEKQHGSIPTFRAANVIFHGFGLSREQGWPILVEYSERCQPPWTEKELIHKMEDAFKAEHDKPFGHLLTPERVESVDLSGLLAPKEEVETGIRPIPGDLFDVPGFVERIMRFCLNSAPYPSKPMAFCGAMALQSYLCSRKVKDESGIRPNLYLLAIGTSGLGKAYPRKINSHILTHIGCGAAAGNLISSGQGLEDAMQMNRKMIFQADEFDNMLRALGGSIDNNHTTLLAMLLQFYSEADETHVMRVKAGGASRGEIHQPGLVIFGTATPECFFEAMSPKLLTNGLFSRSIIIDAGDRGRHQKGRDVDTLPQESIDEARWWVEFNPTAAGAGKANLNDEYPTPQVIPTDGDGQRIFEDLANRADDEYDLAVKGQDSVRYSVWTRAYENAVRLALVYASSRDKSNMVIDREVATWASSFAVHLVERMLFLARRHVAENPFHKECLKILRLIRDAGDHMLAHSEASRKMKTLNSKQFKEMMETLVDQGRILVLPSGYPVGARGCSYLWTGGDVD